MHYRFGHDTAELRSTNSWEPTGISNVLLVVSYCLPGVLSSPCVHDAQGVAEVNESAVAKRGWMSMGIVFERFSTCSTSGPTTLWVLSLGGA